MRLDEVINLEKAPAQIGGAVGGAPVIGTIVAVIRMAQGTDYGAALSQAAVGVAVIAFPAAWLLYFLNGME